MRFILQTWTLTQKDLLLVGRRSWLATILRALILPFIVTFLLGYAKKLSATDGSYGIQTPSRVMDLSDAFRGAPRSKFIVIDNNLRGDDVRAVIDKLSDIAGSAHKHFIQLNTTDHLRTVCRASSRGVTDCFAAVEFWGSPSSPAPGKAAIWNYTLHFDSTIGGSFSDNVQKKNSIQRYILPLQHALNDFITRTNGGPGLPNDIQQYAFAPWDTTENNIINHEDYDSYVISYLSWAFFLAVGGITYHLTGFVSQQREKGLLKLIDAMMPNRLGWERVAARVLSVHLCFDLIYAPGWIAMGAFTGSYTFPETGPGLYIALYILSGLALSSYSVFIGSMFKKEQLAALTALLTALIYAVAVQFGEPLGDPSNTAAGVWVLTILFPPGAFVYFILLSAYQDGFVYSVPPDQFAFTPDTFSLSTSKILGILAVQVVVYPILGGLLETWLHGSSTRSRHLRTTEEMGEHAVRLRGFSKHYDIISRKQSRIQAVTDLSLDLLAGSITVLLGMNGSGKSTTLNAIAGLEDISSGRIDINGDGGIGLCPQANVHWSAMTVEEHIMFFERLKRPLWTLAQSRQEVDRLIADCDLEIKRRARAKTLSGGQMRKLQLAMMLTGGSRVCCIDEASSGIDPLARRKIWEVLLQESGQRTMLLSTHFLDETEVLSDHVAILSNGKLMAEGSVATLKNQHGSGYHVVLPNHVSLEGLRNVPQSVVLVEDYNATILEAPDASALTALTDSLEGAGISKYRIRGPTMEDVFLKLVEEVEKDKDESAATSVASCKAEPGFAGIHHQAGAFSSVIPMQLNTGTGCGALKQTGVLFLKRLIVLKHNCMPYVAALFVPLLVAGLVTRFLISGRDHYSSGLPCISPSAPYSTSFLSVQLSYLVDEGLFGPPDQVTHAKLTRLIPNPYHYEGYIPSGYPGNSVQWNQSTFVNTVDQFIDATKRSISDSQANTNSVSGGFFLGNPPLYAYTTGYAPLAIGYQAALNMLLSNMTFAVSSETFQSAWDPGDLIQGVVAVITTLGFTVFPGLFALYPTAERLHNVRAMQYSNGIISSSLWAAYALFDLIFIILISVFAVVIWSVYYNGWFALSYVFVIFMLYGMAATVYSYLISLVATSQIAALACTSLYNAVISMLFFVAYVGTINNAPATSLDAWFNYIYFFMAPLSPAVSLLRALLITLNVYGLACRGQVMASYPGGITLFGGPILYLTLQIVVLVAVLVYLEAGRSLEVFGIHPRKGGAIVEEIESPEEGDVVDDEKHLTLTEEGLRLYNLTKSFGPNRAVENVSFGVLPSEKLALIGPNGAGKSTTISLIRGEIQPDATDPPAAVYISGDNLMEAPVAAKNHLGVCPQFDAVDSMTLSENLHFYARARGVPDKNSNIRELIATLGLAEHANKLVKKLSGGTKRKLSLAIALIANPTVLLLDEPSSGMDPAAKRALWKILTNISAGRCLLLTTHSMEEAAALCDRAGILATKMLALGTIPRLCAQHGDKIYIHIVHETSPYTSADDVDRIRKWVEATFLVAEAEQRTFGGQVRFAVPIRGPEALRDDALVDGTPLRRLFRIIEAQKAEMGIRDYSIGPATLDEVFMNVVSKHNVAEENTAPEQFRWRLSRLLPRISG